MYRRALAASWLAQPGELPPDQCIEDIFAGGDGWLHSEDFADSNSNSKPQTPRRRHHFVTSNNYDSASGDEGDYASEKKSWHGRMPSGGSATSRLTSRKEKMRNGGKHTRNGSGATVGTSSNGVGPRSQRGGLDGGLEDDGDGRGRSGVRRADEVDEFDAREDLIAWRLPGAVS